MAELRQNANWNEADHPRDDDGKFSNKGGDGKITQKSSSGNNRRKGVSKIEVQLFAAKISEQSDKELKKSRTTLLKRIEEHERKIANPQEEYADWETYSDEIKQNKLNWWKKEIEGFRKTIKQIDERLGRK